MSEVSSRSGRRRVHKATRDDVAQLAGVSTAVVSYVVNDGPRNVAPATRKRVVDAIQKLDYVPNQAARSLAGQPSRTIGLIAPTLANPVWAGLVLGATDIARPKSFLLMVCDVEGVGDLDAHYTEMLAHKQVDGVILAPTAPPSAALTMLRRSDVPAVLVEASSTSAPSVVVDEEALGRLVTRHLIDLGHRRIGFIQEPRTARESWRRLLGYRAALESAGIPTGDELVAETDSAIGDIVDTSRVAAQRLLSGVPRPTAVVAFNDLIGIATIQAARERGLRVPDDISVIGIDDIEAGRYIDPPLTTVPFPSRELGRAATALLLGMLDGDRRPAPVVVPPADLVLRGSTAPPARET